MITAIIVGKIPIKPVETIPLNASLVVLVFIYDHRTANDGLLHWISKIVQSWSFGDHAVTGIAQNVVNDHVKIANLTLGIVHNASRPCIDWCRLCIPSRYSRVVAIFAAARVGLIIDVEAVSRSWRRHLLHPACDLNTSRRIFLIKSEKAVWVRCWVRRIGFHLAVSHFTWERPDCNRISYDFAREWIELGLSERGED